MRSRLLLMGALLLCMAGGSGLPLIRAQMETPDVTVQFNYMVSAGPQVYGTNGWWTDEDADPWRAHFTHRLGAKA